jgi:predicted ATPase
METPGAPHLTRVRLFPGRSPVDDVYPFDLKVLRETQAIEFVGPVTFFAGENGSGKSTLLRALAQHCGIHIWRDEMWTRAEHNPYEEKLSQFISVDWRQGPVPGAYFDAEIARRFAELLDEWAAADPGMFDYFGGRSLLTRSHGQSLMAYFRSRYTRRGLYLMDEPETALSPKSLLELLRLLRNEASRGEAQFVVASHSPILLACPGAVIYSFDEAPLRRVAYEDTSHYRIYRDFLKDRRRFLE